MSWNLTTSGAAVAKAGINCSSISGNPVVMAKWSDEAEGHINAKTRHDWISDVADTNYAGALSDCASSLIANKLIGYDMSGYTSRSEAQTMLDINLNTASTIIADIKEKFTQEKMGVNT